MPEPVLRIEKTAGVVTLTLNRPQAMNALSRGLRTALVDAFAALARDPEADVVIVTGAGRAFCAGLDLKELGDQGLGADATEAAIAGADVIRAMAACEQPIIGAINGFAITGGFELALACDVLIASTEARFADTHARVGIMPGWGLSQKLSRAIGIMRRRNCRSPATTSGASVPRRGGSSTASYPRRSSSGCAASSPPRCGRACPR